METNNEAAIDALASDWFHLVHQLDIDQNNGPTDDNGIHSFDKIASDRVVFHEYIWNSVSAIASFVIGIAVETD